MTERFFNYQTIVVGDRWQRRRFFNTWWKFYRRDPHWVPPYYPALRQQLHPDNTFLHPTLLILEAMRRHAGQPPLGSGPQLAPSWEITVGAAVALKQQAGNAYLGLLRCANDRHTLRTLLEALAEHSGARTLLGPTHLSPYLGAGVLAGHWHLLPPFQTPYNPPYLAELLSLVMTPVRRSRLYHLAVRDPESVPAGPATLIRFDPHRLADDLLSLFQVAVSPWQPTFPTPDGEEARLVLDWHARWPLQGWLAMVKQEPAGFILLQPDLAPLLQRANGGRSLLPRLWLQRAARDAPAARGRLLFGGVLPRQRGQGIGRQLLATAIAEARQQGWQSLVVGPIPKGAAVDQFLEAAGAAPLQQYEIYRWEAPTRGWW